MKDEDKTRQQLMRELVVLRQRVAELEESEAGSRPAEEALREPEQKYRSLVEHSADGIWIVQGLEMKFVNRALVEMFGFQSEDEIVGREFTDFVSPEYRGLMVERGLARERGEPVPRRYEFKALARDGTEFDAELSASYIVYQGRPARQGMIRDLTERKRAERELRASLGEQEILLKEVHHRVKNNLQLISSLLSMARNRCRDQRARDLLTDSMSRVHSMALIHAQLYQERQLQHIDMGKHVRDLVDHLSHVYAGRGISVTPVIEPADLHLPLTQAIPCSLALNEVLSNTFKHAYRKGVTGRLTITLKRRLDHAVVIKVRDDGVGIPEDVDIGKTDSLGLQLIRDLVFRNTNSIT
jgi:PAS domain S-box-containing protein